jgi:hypothetical protein
MQTVPQKNNMLKKKPTKQMFEVYSFQDKLSEVGPCPSKLTSRLGELILLKERNLNMLRKELSLKNPLQSLISEDTPLLPPAGGFGAITARAGVGKTALLVQLALNHMLSKANVLHVGLNEPVDKVRLWYRSQYKSLTTSIATPQANLLWDEIQPHRLIMSFKAKGFNIAKLKDGLTDLIDQDIFKPTIIIIDGYYFGDSSQKELTELKSYATSLNAAIWFTVPFHRHEDLSTNGVPPAIETSADLFEVIIQLQPESDHISVKLLRGGNQTLMADTLQLDSTTMLLTSN